MKHEDLPQEDEEVLKRIARMLPASADPVKQFEMLAAEIGTRRVILKSARATGEVTKAEAILSRWEKNKKKL